MPESRMASIRLGVKWLPLVMLVTSDPASPRQPRHVEDPGMQQGLTLAVELEVLQIREAGEHLLEVLEGQVRLVHGAPAAEPADEVAAGGGLDLEELDAGSSRGTRASPRAHSRAPG